MKSKILILTMLIATTFFALPADSNAQGKSKQWKSDRHQDQVWSGLGQNKSRHKSYNGYRNYGQYRRTQVGNRRFRMERRYYKSDTGSRLSRLVRVFY